MSNANVGVVYEHIIQEVINTVRVDFEEGGVAEDVLEELKKAWQQKLSQLNVATFPWDPKPEPPPAPAPAAPAPVAAPAHIPHPPQQQPAAASYTQSTLTPQAAAHPAAMAQYSNGNGVSVKPDNDPLLVKQEPGMGGMPAPTMAYNNSGPPHSGGMAAARAAQQLDNRYGQRAAASIDAIQRGQAQAQQQNPRPGQPQPMQPMQMNQQQMAQHQMNQQQYRQGVAASMQQRMPQQPPSNLPNAQHDGATDGFEGVLMQRGPDGRPVEMGRVEIDQIIHAQMAARAKEMEGGGLMVPLRKVGRRAGTASKKVTPDGPSQMDGPDDDDDDDEKVELDEDAINSDLDDPDDARDDDEEDDDSMGQMMLCMYDKVQRVKNKWKCTLKDGVLTVNGREYVFQKATGEYEW